MFAFASLTVGGVVDVVALRAPALVAWSIVRDLAVVKDCERAPKGHPAGQEGAVRDVDLQGAVDPHLEAVAFRE